MEPAWHGLDVHALRSRIPDTNTDDPADRSAREEKLYANDKCFDRRGRGIVSRPAGISVAQGGFEATVVGDGPAALAEFDRSGADIVLLDLMLPGMTGTDVCKRLRARSSVPVIMVTARDSEIDKVVGLELGADDYVTKPYSARELIARIRAVLRRGAENEDPG